MRLQPVAVALAVVVARLWTRLYTAGLPRPDREARRQEIESDLWDTTHAAGPGELSASLQVLGRLAGGMTDDLGWRWEQEATMARTRMLAMAVGVPCGLALIWIVFASRPPIGPSVPRPPQRTLLAALGAPPPPAPPPALPGSQAPRVTFTYGQASYTTLDGTPVPVRLEDVRPVHSPMAKSAGVGGTVVVDATIDENGRVPDARVRESVPMLDQSAVDAVRQWVFVPRSSAPRVVTIRVRVEYPQPQ